MRRCCSSGGVVAIGPPPTVKGVSDAWRSEGSRGGRGRRRRVCRSCVTAIGVLLLYLQLDALACCTVSEVTHAVIAFLCGCFIFGLHDFVVAWLHTLAIAYLAIACFGDCMLWELHALGSLLVTLIACFGDRTLLRLQVLAVAYCSGPVLWW